MDNQLNSEIDPSFRARAQFILENVERAKPKKILDAGCGRGFYLQALVTYPFISHIFGFDLNDSYLRQAKKRIRDKRLRLTLADLYNLPYRENSFDMIICSEVLEHVKNDKKAMHVLMRLLKKNGLLLVTVPNINFPFLWDPLNFILMKKFKTHIPKHIWWLAGIWADHERLYTKEQIVSLVKNSGFELIKVKQIIHWSWPFSHFLLYGIGKNIVERLGMREFNRFNTQKKPITEFVAKTFRLPSEILDRHFPTKSSINTLIAARKK